MKHALALIAAFLCCAVATYVMVKNVAVLATSPTLLWFVGGFYLLGLLIAIPANMKAAIQQGGTAWQTFKGSKPDQPSV